MIQAIPPDQADQSLRISVLPRRSCRSRPVTNAHRMKAAGKNVAVDGVSVTDDVTWCCFPPKSLRELTSDPFSRWVCSNPETTRCRQHDYAGTSSSPGMEAAY